MPLKAAFIKLKLMIKLLKKSRVESSEQCEKGKESYFFVIGMKIKFANDCMDWGK